MKVMKLYDVLFFYGKKEEKMYKIHFTNKRIGKRYMGDTSSIEFISVLMGEAEGIIWANKEVNADLLIIWNECERLS